MKFHDQASLDDLAAFAAVARLRSYTRAAASLKTSTSNLSHTIRRLEAQLGYRVLQRNSRSVSATEAGEMLLLELGPALDSIRHVLERLGEEQETISGTLRLTLTRQAYEAVVRPVLPKFTAEHPRATVELSIDYGYRDIVADNFDAGIRLGEKLQQDMIAFRVGPDLQMAVVASPEYLARSAAIGSPGDLAHHRCINYRLVAGNMIYSWEFEKRGQALAIPVNGPVTTNEPDLMLQMALDGLGVAYLLEHEVAPHLKSGRLIRKLADWTPSFPGFHLYYPSRRQMRPVLAAFNQALRSSRQSTQTAG
ncbi:LysR family transcriptional regulator [Radicibacter daui]|uniref:LysR family transcriptional regulator n=1 Tax=Radicibacter daui TaxID=3064829 RepID=UPI0040468D4C